MKNLSLLFNAVLLFLVGVLFWFQFFKPSKNSSSISAKPDAAVISNGGSFKVAYFIMDSLDSGYEKVKDARKETAAREEAENNKIASLEREMQKKAMDYENKLKANQMSQVEYEAAQRDIAQMKDNYIRQKQLSEQSLMEANAKKIGEIKKEIEDFLKEYNKDRVYNYIFMYDASSQFLYCDTVYDITRDVLQGLNKRYQKK